MSRGLGKRGEAIFAAIISRCQKDGILLFDPAFLGDTYPTVDYYVGLNQYSKKKAFFIASVKLTTLGFSQNNGKLKIQISKKDIGLLNKFAVPVYLFGINDNKINEEGFFISANQLDSKFNGLSIKYPMNIDNMEKLWKEVCNYWENNNEITNFVSSFKI